MLNLDGVAPSPTPTFCGTCHGRGTLTGQSRLKILVIYDCDKCGGTGEGPVPADTLVRCILPTKAYTALVEEIRAKAWGEGYDEGLNDGMTK